MNDEGKRNNNQGLNRYFGRKSSRQREWLTTGLCIFGAVVLLLR